MVDDNIDAGQSLMLLLRDMGHEAHLALNGDSALDIVRWFKPEIVFLDLVLGDIEGWDLAGLLRRETGMEQARILALTAYGSEYDRLRSLKAGCDEHFVKPIAQRVLERVLAAR